MAGLRTPGGNSLPPQKGAGVATVGQKYIWVS